MHAAKGITAQNRVGNDCFRDFNWYLNVTSRWADYFRRWHGRMARSGSLWVHKATHHLICLTGVLNSEPVEVSAYGSARSLWKK
jgi:predicted dehydrogenase